MKEATPNISYPPLSAPHQFFLFANVLYQDLQEDLKRIKSSLNIDMVVTLLTHHEMQVMECADMGVRLERLGMRWIHFPIRDKWVPLPGQTKAFLNDLIVPIAESLCEGKRVLAPALNAGMHRAE